MLHVQRRNPGELAGLFLQSGSYGTAEENRHNNARMAQVLRWQGHPVRVAAGRDGHNFTSWRDTFHPYLTQFLADLWGADRDNGGPR